MRGPFSEKKKVGGVKEQHPELFSGLPRYEHTQHKFRHREGEEERRGGVSRDMSLPSATKKSSVPNSLLGTAPF
ncbi:rCG56268, isoform CRA_b [Rattus norvegicus]|uniref:RCG56268, isoform CRA_b n=1 Tax=Rattus norvegicus TaxID=10116 RepID=A6IAJ9_RAT|nr:rCG56268, isoform CRA_b [Rattus norvegicus]